MWPGSAMRRADAGTVKHSSDIDSFTRSFVAGPHNTHIYTHMRYLSIAVDDELGAGLNNALMCIAQMLDDACRSDSVFVLPKFTSGWRFFKLRGQHTRRPFAFDELFDAAHFIDRVRPCAAVASPPAPLPANSSFRKAKLVAINKLWPARYGHALPRVYSALRPSAQLLAVVDRLASEAAAAAGPRWTAVHLRIERDWWEDTDFCWHPRYPSQRCFTPTQAAALTLEHRKRRHSTGAVLFYAADNVSPRGPRVVLSAFGNRTTTIDIPTKLPYTMRSAAELFLATRAPGGFYGCRSPVRRSSEIAHNQPRSIVTVGNSFSSFSRGVAMMRRMRGDEKNASAALALPQPSALGARSFAYDCGSARNETPSSVGGMQFLSTVNLSGCPPVVARRPHRRPVARHRRWGSQRSNASVTKGRTRRTGATSPLPHPCARAFGAARLPYLAARANPCAAEISFKRQVSRTPCELGRTYGIGRGDVWVARGCRAVFRCGGRPPTDGEWDPDELIQCGDSQRPVVNATCRCAGASTRSR